MIDPNSLSWRALTQKELQQFIGTYPDIKLKEIDQYYTPYKLSKKLFKILQLVGVINYPEPIANLILASRLDKNFPKYSSEDILNLNRDNQEKFATAFNLPVNQLPNRRIWKILKIANLLYPPLTVLKDILAIEQFCDQLDFESIVRLREALGNWDLNCRISLPMKYHPITYFDGVNPLTIDAYRYLKAFGSAEGALITYCGLGDTDIVQLFLNYGMSPNTEYNGSYCIHQPAQFGHLDTVKFLIEKGADINQVDDSHNSALMLAVRDNHLEVVKYLVGKGADLEQRDEGGYTALLLAVAHGRINVVEYLIEIGADLQVQNEDGENALRIAQVERLDNLSLILKRAGL